MLKPGGKTDSIEAVATEAAVDAAASAVVTVRVHCFVFRPFLLLWASLLWFTLYDAFNCLVAVVG